MRALLAVMTVSSTCIAATVQYEPITVYRDGRELLVRSFFSKTQDVVTKIHYSSGSGMPNEQAYLIPNSSKLLDFEKYDRMHNSNDDLPGYPLPMYGTLGGNHGSPHGRVVNIPEHGLTSKDLGAELTTKNKGSFYILRIIDKDNILIHPENRGKPGFPKFAPLRKNKIFRNGIELKYADVKRQQVYPSNRYRENSYLINGTEPLPDKTEVKCDFIDHVVDYDIVMPECRVEMFRDKPGIEHDFVDPKLPAMLNVRNVFRYQANGACVIYLKNTVLCDMAGYNCLGVMMCWSGSIANKKRTEFYIPKLKPLKATGKAIGRNKAPALDCDFSSIYEMPDKMFVDYNIIKKDCLDPKDPPDRFIRLVGGKKREIGAVVGYSLYDGVTAKALRAKDRERIYHLSSSKKMYPYCINIRNCRKGDVREVLAYRQYFDPQREPDATSFYFHKQNDSDVVYLDFHKSLLKKKIALPDYMTGKKISILEKTPSVVLHTESTVPKDGICLSISGDYGYIVLKLD